MPKTKSGEIISWKEYFKRWKAGIDGITPVQKLKGDIYGTTISLLGYFIAIGILLYQGDFMGWLSYALLLIFIGSSITTGLKLISLKQQLKFMEDLDLEMNKDDSFQKEEVKGGIENGN